MTNPMTDTTSPITFDFCAEWEAHVDAYNREQDAYEALDDIIADYRRECADSGREICFASWLGI